jgi:hypothetical protein
MAKVFHLLGFGIPLIQSVIPLAMGIYKPAGFWYGIINIDSIL